jgi:predicted site-specific integrase-resolvase
MKLSERAIAARRPRPGRAALEGTDDLVRDAVEVLAGSGARLYGRRGAHSGAPRAVTAAKRSA